MNFLTLRYLRASCILCAHAWILEVLLWLLSQLCGQVLPVLLSPQKWLRRCDCEPLEMASTCFIPPLSCLTNCLKFPPQVIGPQIIRKWGMKLWLLQPVRKYCEGFMCPSFADCPGEKEVARGVQPRDFRKGKSCKHLRLIYLPEEQLELTTLNLEETKNTNILISFGLKSNIKKAPWRGLKRVRVQLYTVVDR